MAHDFNNLLMGIQGRTSLMLLEPDPSAAYHEHLKSIEAYVQNATGLTRQLLGFARGGKYDPKPTAINRIIEEGVSLFGRTKKEIRIRRNLLADLWAVEVDRGQIQQVLLNLYVNAWQAMPGGGDLFIQTANQVLTKAEAVRQQLAPGNYITITVKDTGVGMDPSILSKIFDPFFTTKERGRGTGLGLAASYGIIHNHGGTIVATSKPGTGAAFILYLPASERVPTAGRPADRPPLPGAGTVLLVDDEPMILDVAKMMLEKLGYQVETADSGEAALRKYGSHKTTIVILDMIMPDMGGGEVFDRLKSMDPEVRVLLSSGYSLSGQTQEVFNRGCSGFIQKPFTLDGLSHRLHTVLHNK
jgi:CheY-like chemotaxis protein